LVELFLPTMYFVTRTRHYRPRPFLFYSRFTNVQSGHVWKLIKRYINQLCGETPTDFLMGVPAPTTNFVGLSVTLNEGQRKAFNSKFSLEVQFGREPRELEDWLEAQPQRCARNYL
jgi:hypothetical protein